MALNKSPKNSRFAGHADGIDVIAFRQLMHDVADHRYQFTILVAVESHRANRMVEDKLDLGTELQANNMGIPRRIWAQQPHQTAETAKTPLIIKHRSWKLRIGEGSALREIEVHAKVEWLFEIVELLPGYQRGQRAPATFGINRLPFGEGFAGFRSVRKHRCPGEHSPPKGIKNTVVD